MVSFQKPMLLVLHGIRFFLINPLKAEDILKLLNFTASQYSALEGPARCPGDWLLRSSSSPSVPIIVTERTVLHSSMKKLQFQIQTLMNAYDLLSVVKPRILKSNHCNLGSISTLQSLSLHSRHHLPECPSTNLIQLFHSFFLGKCNSRK